MTLCLYEFFLNPFFQKWTKGRSRDKLQNKVIFDQDAYDKLMSEIPQYRLISPAVVSDRLKINGSLARAAILLLAEKGLIRKVDQHSSQYIYTRIGGDVEAQTTQEETAKGGKGKKAKK